GPCQIHLTSGTLLASPNSSFRLSYEKQNVQLHAGEILLRIEQPVPWSVSAGGSQVHTSGILEFQVSASRASGEMNVIDGTVAIDGPNGTREVKGPARIAGLWKGKWAVEPLAP